jgi:hypothetical protein
VDDVKFRTLGAYFQSIDAYIKWYSQRATLRFWLWKVRMDMKVMGVTEEELAPRLTKVRSVSHRWL